MKINIFGSTGIIGSKTLDIISNNFPLIKINLLCSNTTVRKLIKQIKIYSPKYVYLNDSTKINFLKKNIKSSIILLNFNELNFSRNESIEDTFKAINCYVDGLVYRTSSHEKLLIAEKYFKKPIINVLSEKSHPCQII